jgi:hypothetical protein
MPQPGHHERDGSRSLAGLRHPADSILAPDVSSPHAAADENRVLFAARFGYEEKPVLDAPRPARR